MSILVSKKPVEVAVDYVEVEDHLIVITTEDQRNIFKDSIKTVKAKFDRVNYGNFNMWVQNCLDKDPLTGLTKIDEMKMKKNKFECLLQDIIDGEGKNILVDRDLFININADLAIALIDKYDEQLGEEKNEALKKAGFYEKIEKYFKDKEEVKEEVKTS